MLTKLLVLTGALCAVSNAAGIIDHSLQKRFLGGGGGGGDGQTENVLVSFNQNIQSVFQQINRMNFSSTLAKRTALTQMQEAFTATSQAPLKAVLGTMGVEFQSFWISNKMVIQNANPALVNAIARAPNVARVEKEPVLNVNPAYVGTPEYRPRRQAEENSTVEWNIERIGANQLWGDNFTGKGIVVAGIDTGVRYTHEALAGRWRKNNGWLDPYLPSWLRFLSRTPSDGNGHGTHTMATIVGTHGVGVAPDATYIACKGCSTLGCTAAALLTCGEFVQCPTDYRGNNKNCSLAPDVVSNSWGGGQNQSFYDEVIQSWHTAGIIPVFAIGNEGPDCGTASSPGDRPGVIAVGSIEKNNQISSFSSLGPTLDGRMKPDIVAPGGKVKSAWHTGDTAYNTISGTSMACPAISGVVTLMLQKDPTLEYDAIYKAITSTATTASLDSSNAPESCGNITTASFPNNIYGYGLVNAVNSLKAIG